MTSFSRNGIQITATLCVLALTACGGGGGGDTGTPDPSLNPEPSPINTSSYVALRQSQNVSSPLQAAAISTNGDARQVITRTGLYDHADGTSTVGGAVAQINQDVPGLYDFASGFSQNTGGADVSGVLGVAIRTEDMPDTGGATYTGGAVGFVITDNTGVDLSDGDSTVLVNFANDRVNVTLDGFTATDQTDGSAATAPIDRIRINGMQISDGTYTGGTIVTSRAGTTVDVTGNNTSNAAAGAFFGLDGDNPAETGGVVFSDGDSGQVFGQFIAD